MKTPHVLIASLALCASSFAASTAPLSATWNVAPAGTATSDGELVFRMTPGGDDDDPVEVTVSVRSGADDLAIARDIRQALSSGLARERFNVQLGTGVNVIVTDQRGEPNFSLELVDSDVDNLRVTVQSLDATASPTVPAQAVPAVTPGTAPARNTSSGNALPADSQPANAAVPANSAPANAGQPNTPPPSNSPPLPNGSPPPNATPGGGPANAPPRNATPGGAPANAPPPNATPGGAPASAPPPG